MPTKERFGNQACEYCGTRLPIFKSKKNRQVRSEHYANCETRLNIQRQAAVDQEIDERNMKIAYLEDGGFTAEQARTLINLLEDNLYGD